MIVARGLSKRFGSTVAVDSLSSEVRPGVVPGLLGPDGSGKSTTIDWNALIARVHGGHGSDARRQAGAWAMAQARKALGERWPRQWLARYGTLPAFARDPASDAFAYAQLVETGLSLHSLDDAPRLPTVKHWSSQLEDISMRHAWIQPELAALARFQGTAVEFQTPVQLPATERPADVVLTTEDAQLVAGCFCVYTDQLLSEVEQAAAGPRFAARPRDNPR